MWILRRSAVSSLVLSNCRTEKRFYTAWAVSCLLQRAAIGRDTDVCPSRGHLGGSSSVPNYQIRGKELYPALGHANGSCSVPHYRRGCLSCARASKRNFVGAMVEIELRCGSHLTVMESLTLSSNRSLRSHSIWYCRFGELRWVLSNDYRPVYHSRRYSHLLTRLALLGLSTALGRKWMFLSVCY